MKGSHSSCILWNEETKKKNREREWICIDCSQQASENHLTRNDIPGLGDSSWKYIWLVVIIFKYFNFICKAQILTVTIERTFVVNKWNLFHLGIDYIGEKRDLNPKEKEREFNKHSISHSARVLHTWVTKPHNNYTRKIPDGEIRFQEDKWFVQGYKDSNLSDINNHSYADDTTLTVQKEKRN